MFRTSVAVIRHIRFELSNNRPTLVFYVLWDENHIELLRFDFTLPSSKQVMFALQSFCSVDDLSKLESREIRIILKDEVLYALGNMSADEFFTVRQNEDEFTINTFEEIASEGH